MIRSLRLAIALLVVGITCQAVYAAVKCDCNGAENLGGTAPANYPLPSNGLCPESSAPLPTDGTCDGESITADCDLIGRRKWVTYYSYEATDTDGDNIPDKCVKVPGTGESSWYNYNDCYVQ